MIEIFPTAESLAEAAARHIASCAAEAIAARGRFTLVLSGGATPRAAYSRLAALDSQHELDWPHVQIFWGDERCVPPDDPRSNYGMAKEVLLDRVPIPPGQIHRIKGEDEPEKAAAEYESTLRSVPGLDLVLLGLGDDGHTASLFPGQPAVHQTERWVVAVPPGGSRSPDVWRVTLTPPILNAARNVTFIVSGASKSQRLAAVLDGPFDPDLLPAQAILPREGRLTWMVDEAAAARLQVAPS